MLKFCPSSTFLVYIADIPCRKFNEGEGLSIDCGPMSKNYTDVIVHPNIGLTCNQHASQPFYGFGKLGYRQISVARQISPSAE